MRSIFYRWMKTLTERDITNFVSLYSNNSVIFTKINTKLIYNNPYNNGPPEEIFRGKIGSFRNFENTLFSNPGEFKIGDYNLSVSEKEKRIIFNYDFTFKNENFKSDNIMMFSEDLKGWEICYHQSILSK